MKRLATMVCLSLAVTVWSMADIIRVPKEQPTIQAGIDAAGTGDTVLVARGTYFENIDFKGKAIIVRSLDGPADTVIDGGTLGSVVTFTGREQRNTVLDGFTVTNGSGWGAGIYCIESSPRIKNNMIIYNGAGEKNSGGGLFCSISCPEITGNLIAMNTAGSGAGIYSMYSAPKIMNNMIIHNAAESTAGGIRCFSSFPEVENNVISWNTAKWGGGVECSGGEPYIKRNTITHNYAVYMGGGLYLTGSSSNAVVMDNMIAENFAGSTGGGICINHVTAMMTNNRIIGNKAGEGGAIDSFGTIMTLSQNTIVGNSASISGGAFHLRYCDLVKITNSILWNDIAPAHKEIHNENSNVVVAHCDIQDELWASEPGCFNADPHFVDATGGDCHLAYPSPCRDSGDAALVTNPADFEGDPRVAFGAVDMGADEFHPHLYCTGDAVPGGMIEAKLIGLPGTSPVGLLFGTDVADPPFPTPWGRCYLLPPMVLLPLSAIPADGVLVLPLTIPNPPPAVGEFPMQALLDTGPESLTNLYLLEIQ